MTPRKKTRSCSPWSALPPDMAGELLLRLPSYADRLCFGAVCRSWRASSAPHRSRPPRLPCIVSIDGTFGGFPEADRPFRLPRAAGHVGSSGAWLLFRRFDGGYSLLNPFSMAAMAPLPILPPSAARARRKRGGVRAARERVLDEYDVVGLQQRRVEEEDEDPCRSTQQLSVRKLVVGASGLVAAVVGGDEGRLGKFAVCWPGAASWSVCSQDQWRRLKDVVVHRGELYAVDHNEDLLAVTVDVGGAPEVSRIRRAVRGAPPRFAVRRHAALHYLVDKGDDLLMVRREVCGGRPGRRGVAERFTVFKANFARSRWAKVTALGEGVALFLGRWGSRAVRAPSDDENRENWTNRIYFLDDGASDQGRCLRRCTLTDYGVSFPKIYSTLPATTVDDEDMLTSTWIFPQD